LSGVLGRNIIKLTSREQEGQTGVIDWLDDARDPIFETDTVRRFLMCLYGGDYSGGFDDKVRK
jgi:hypothetical protein